MSAVGCSGALAVSAFGQVIESPTTVAKGSWLIEADVGFGVWDRSGRGNQRIEFREIGALPVLLSTGLTDRWDVQVGFDGWIETTLATSTGEEQRVSGWGDAYVRTKWNFAGDEASGPAWSVLPYLKLPVADSDMGNGEFEGGLALLYGQPINESDWMEAFVSGDSLRSEVGGRDEFLVAGVVWGRSVSDTTTVYTEVLVEWLSTKSGEVPVTLGVGVSPEMAPGFAWDFEVLAGITPEAADWAVVLRIGWEL